MIHTEPHGSSALTDSNCSVRHVAGTEADELFILCGPAPGTGDDIASQTQSIYRSMAAALGAAGGGLANLIHETALFRDIRLDRVAFQQARSSVFRELGTGAIHPALTCIEQPPLTLDGRLQVSAFALIPRGQGTAFDRTAWTRQLCGCADCAQCPARIFRVDGDEYLYAGNIFGVDGDAFTETVSMFTAAEELLRKEGFSFRDVVRTWIYLREIDRDYAELNRGRRDFFKRAGISLYPASTGIEGAPFPPAHNISLSLYAIKSAEPASVEIMTTPTLNEAPDYGSDFSRGLKVVEANKIALYVSGTASVDEAGRTAHQGDLPAQVERMLENIVTLLDEQNASVRNIVSAITYLKNPADASALQAILRSRGFDGFPNAIVKAGVCRPDLLCEMEAIAALPRGPRRS